MIDAVLSEIAASITTESIRPSDLLLPELGRGLLEHWSQLRVDDTPPARATLDPMALRRWIGDLCLVTLHEGEKRFFMQLHGGNVVKYIGRDFSRQYLEDCTPAYARKLVFEPYEICIRERSPVYTLVSSRQLDGRFNRFNRLILPMTAPAPSDDSPAPVSSFLVLVEPTDLDEIDSDFIYGSDDAVSEARGEPEERALTVVIDPDYPLRNDKAPAAAARPVAKQA